MALNPLPIWHPTAALLSRWQWSCIILSFHPKERRMSIDLAIPAAAAQLDALASELLRRREAILDEWRNSGDPAAPHGIESSLSRAQFNDHIPAVLDCLAHTIRAWPGE